MCEREYRNTLKRKATDSGDTPGKIIRDSGASTHQIVQTRATKKAQKQLINRTRFNNSNKELESTESTPLDIPIELTKTLNGDQFLQKEIRSGEETIIIFATAQNFQYLSTAEFWIMDGTFSTVPIEFKQLYSIHATVGSDLSKKTLPLVYILLSKKSQQIYKTALVSF